MILSTKQQQLLDMIDSHLNTGEPIIDDGLTLTMIEIPIHNQFMSVENIFNKMKLPEGQYIPRSVALINNGLSWQIIIGMRTVETCDPATTALFMSVLAITNDARQCLQNAPESRIRRFLKTLLGRRTHGQ